MTTPKINRTRQPPLIDIYIGVRGKTPRYRQHQGGGMYLLTTERASQLTFSARASIRLPFFRIHIEIGR